MRRSLLDILLLVHFLIPLRFLEGIDVPLYLLLASPSLNILKMALREYFICGSIQALE